MSKTEQKLFNKIRKQVGKAIGDFNMIEEGDRIAVGISGGKDSYTLLDILETLRKKAPVKFGLVAINFDAGFPGYQKENIEAYLKENKYTYHMEETGSYQIIEDNIRPGSSYCAFCARLRRGHLYSLAEKLNCNKIALGHHLDDIIETLLLNQFYGGKLAAMSAKLIADNGKHTVIRPLVYVEENDIAAYSLQKEFPIVDCGCPAQAMEDQQRQRMKQLITELSKNIPQIRNSMIAAAGNIHPSHLLDQRFNSFSAPEDESF